MCEVPARGVHNARCRLHGQVHRQLVAIRPGTAIAGCRRVNQARVALDPGQNVIEVVAYNAAGLLASAPRQVTVNWDGVASSEPPALHVLAVGVNDYADGRLQPDAGSNPALLEKAVAHALYAQMAYREQLHR